MNTFLSPVFGRLGIPVSILLVAILVLAVTACTEEPAAAVSEDDVQFEVLVFSKTAGFRHNSIEDGIEAVRGLGAQYGFGVTATEDADYFTDDNLAGYEAVIFLNTTETVFDEEQREAFRQYIQEGGGFVGVHSAADTEYDWPWYGELVGAYFESHPSVQEASIDVVDGDHISTRMLPDPWVRTDEWYHFRDVYEGINVLLNLDEDSYDVENSDPMGEEHPIAWYHEYDGGRAWYTGLGHTRESYSEPLFLEHLLGGILWAAQQEELATEAAYEDE